MQCHHNTPPTHPQIKKNQQSLKKLMATMFWDVKSVLFVDFIPHGLIVNTDTVKQQTAAVCQKRSGCLHKCAILLQDTTNQHTADLIKELCCQYGCDILLHSLTWLL